MKNGTLSTTFEDIKSLLMKNIYTVVFLIILMSVIVTIFWYEENENTSITIELDVLSIEPKDSSLNSTIKILFNDSSGKQVENIVCNCSETLYRGETQVIVIDNIIYNNFNISLIMDGKWDKVTVNLRLDGTDKHMEPFVIIASHSPALYDIPKDTSEEHYFKMDSSK